MIAREFSLLHEELRFEVLEEVLTRIPTLDRSVQHRLILYLSGWISHFDLSAMDSDDLLNVLHELVLLTSYYSEDRVDLLQKLWSSLATSEANVKMITHFMIDTMVSRVCTSFSFLFFLSLPPHVVMCWKYSA